MNRNRRRFEYSSSMMIAIFKWEYACRQRYEDGMCQFRLIVNDEGAYSRRIFARSFLFYFACIIVVGSCIALQKNIFGRIPIPEPRSTSDFRNV